MTDKQTPANADQPVGPTDEGDDTEGHSMFLNPSTSADMARARSKEVERQAREHARQKESRAKGK
jgi:hypothetical protein